MCFPLAESVNGVVDKHTGILGEEASTLLTPPGLHSSLPAAALLQPPFTLRPHPRLPVPSVPASPPGRQRVRGEQACGCAGTHTATPGRPWVTPQPTSAPTRCQAPPAACVGPPALHLPTEPQRSSSTR